MELIDTYQSRSAYYLVMELCTGGELMNRIVQMQVFSEATAAFYFRHMCEAVRWCHEHHVAHRDIKPENFLLSDSSDAAELKLTDFGLSTFVASKDTVIRDACGSAYYIAPEVFQRRYTQACDLWSLGVVLYLLLSGTVPFGAEAEEEMQVYRAIQTEPLRLHGGQWRSISSAAQELVVGLLEKDASKRYTIEQVLSHPWVTGRAAPRAALDPGVVRSMAAFTNNNRFRKQALKLITSMLSAADVAKLRQQFVAIDTDGTGTITRDELADALHVLGLDSSTDPNALFAQLDADGDGVISYEEFLVATAERQLVHHQTHMWWVFCQYDKDGDGTITVQELRDALKGEPEATVQDFIAEYDNDNDGTINYEEFMRMLLPKDLNFKITKQADAEQAGEAAPAS